MSNITDWIKQELYPSLYDSIDTALPEFNFKKHSGGWRSSLKIDLSNPKEKRADKTIVSKKAPGWILEQGGEVLSLVDYVIKRDGVDFIKAVQTLARVVGLQIPKGDFNPEEYKQYSTRLNILQESNRYFTDCLKTSQKAEAVRSYLSDRGYSDEDVEAMELGYIPSREKLYKYLEGKGYSTKDIGDVLTLTGGIGTTHILTIPWYSGGTLKGFNFRTLTDHKLKYLISSGLDKSGGFFNLSGIKGDKDVIIVEGELDSLHATVKGVPNVVATGGSSVNPEQIRDAIKRGAKSFTICFDNEPGKGTDSIDRAIEVIRGEGVNIVYIVNLPDLGGGKTDPDRLIKEKGIEAFNRAIKERLSYGFYLGDKLFKDYESKAIDGVIDVKERDLLRKGIAEIRPTLSAIDRVDFNKYLIHPLQQTYPGFEEEILQDMEESVKEAIQKANRDKQTGELIKKAQANPEEALKILEEGVKNIKATTGSGLIPPPKSFTDIVAEIATMPPAYKTGYESLDKYVGIKPGAITLVAGRPGHGKTTFMYNVLLNMTELYPTKQFYFFTYEEPERNLYIKILNRIINSDLPRPDHYEFIKEYLRDRRNDNNNVESGKDKLSKLIDSGRIRVIGTSYSVEKLSALISYLNKKENIGAVFIDYIQRMSTEKPTQDKRNEIAHISDQVLQIAKDSGLPIILGAQLNREGAGKSPQIQNLKEAGNLEEDANLVLSVYCSSADEEENRGRDVELEVKTLKNREGEVDRTTKLDWDRVTQNIKDKEANKPTSFR